MRTVVFVTKSVMEVEEEEDVKFQKMQEALTLLYDETNELSKKVASIYECIKKGDENTAVIHQHIERNKVLFYKWVQLVLDDAQIVTPTYEQDSSFFVVQQSKPGQETTQTIDELFQELLQMIRFVMDVAKNRDKEAMMSIDENTLKDVKGYIESLRFRILENVDNTNLSPGLVNSQETVLKMRVTQQDYERLNNKFPFISYNVIAANLLPRLPSDIVLLGPPHMERLTAQGEESRYCVALSNRLANKRLVLWVLEIVTEENNMPYSLLLLTSRYGSHDDVIRTRFVLYMPGALSLTIQQDLYRHIKENVLLKVWESATHSLQLEYVANSDASSLYVARIIEDMSRQKLEEHNFDETPFHALVSRTVATHTLDVLLSHVESLKTSVKRRLFEFITSRDIGVHTPEKDDDILNVRIPVLSRISDLARLTVSSELIDADVLTDMTNLFVPNADCHILAASFWKGLASEHSRHYSVFSNSAINLIFMPVLNQTSKHWSLCVIDTQKNTLSYYAPTSRQKLLDTTFQREITSFLQEQMPGTSFEARILNGPTAEDDALDYLDSCSISILKAEEEEDACLDCALYIINMISALAVDRERRRIYTRESVFESITARLIKSVVSNERSVASFFVDVLHRFFDKRGEDELSSVTIWSSLKKRGRTVLKSYRTGYLNILTTILASTLRFTPESITVLRRALEHGLKKEKGLGSVEASTGNAHVVALFNNLELADTGMQEKQNNKKRVQFVVDADDNIVPEVRTFKKYIRTPQEALASFLKKMRKLKKKEKLLSRSKFAKIYGTSIRKRLPLFAKEGTDLEIFFDAFIEALFAKDMNTALMSVLNEYTTVTVTPKGEEEDKKGFLKCFYCSKRTNQVDPLTQKIYCSTNCRTCDTK